MVEIKVGDIMTRNFISASPDTSLINCARKMIKNRVGSLLLVEDKKLKGIITEKDIVWALTKKQGKGLDKIPASDITPKKLSTIKPSATIDEAIARMKKMKFRRLPVMVNGTVIGILTLKDILKIEPDFLHPDYFNLNDIRELSDKLKRKQNPSPFQEGLCEECGNTDLLYKTDGRLICEDCINSM